MKKPALSRSLLFTIFTISGFSGLIYESIWSHYLKLFLGHAAYAQTLVLSIFMGGMALGAWLVSRYTGRIRNLLVAYAAVEFVTGVMALAFHSVYIHATAFAFDSAIPALENAVAINTFKWTLGALLILPQSILLGSTFPLISAGVIRKFPERGGETLAMLYFTNSLGAALGVLASGFWLIGAVGLPGTVMAAGILNVLLALFVWVLARDENIPAAPPAPTVRSGVIARGILIAAFLAGLASFVYEIAWIRMLSLVLGSSTHAFELMLSAFILGLALGGYWIRRRIAGYSHPQRTLAIMFSLMAILAALTLPAYAYTFDVMAATLKTFAPTDGGYAGFNVVSHAIAAAMMIPTTLIAGMTLPLMTHYLLRTNAGEQAIGKVYAANTLGAIAGVLLAIHALLPFVGTKGAVIAGALVQAGIAMLLLRGEAREQRTWFASGAIAAGVLVVLMIALTVQLDPMRMASGVYRQGIAALDPSSKVIYLRDGKTATISLSRQGNLVSIATNGKPDAAINMGAGAAGIDEITMTLAAALPLAIHPSPRRIANIGIGSGLTSHVLLNSPVVETLDSIEIEPAIAEAARMGFGTRVHNLFDDPRSHIHFEDAKTFFAASRQPYDLIVSEPSNPWVSGVASLFSEEFYSHIRRYLAPGGLLVQWVQVYETDVTVVASIVKALSPNFMDYVVYNTDDMNILIIASADGPVALPRADIFAGALGENLRRVAVNSLADIELRRIGGKQSLDALFNSFPVPKNSDFFPFVDLTAPKMRFLHRDAVQLSELARQSVPVLELLGEPGLTTAATRFSGASFVLRQNLVQRALDVRDGLVNADPGDLPADIAMDVLTISTPDSSCLLPHVRDVWVQAMATVAGHTTPFFSAEDAVPVWRAIRSSPCLARLSATQRQRVDFLEAVAARDRNAIVARGLELLNETNALPTLARVQVLKAVIASILGMKDNVALGKLLEDERTFILQNLLDDFGLRLVEVRGLAQLSQRTTAHAGTAVGR